MRSKQDSPTNAMGRDSEHGRTGEKRKTDVCVFGTGRTEMVTHYLISCVAPACDARTVQYSTVA